jgi:protein-S-isoprenylcysteine O-methyltransferase Ste14
VETTENREQSPAQDRRTSLIQRIRVPLGFAFAAAFAFLSQPTMTSLCFGLALASSGLLLRIWSTGYLRKHQELCVTGPYRWTRNPLYLGSFLLGFGFSIAASNLWILLLFLILFISVYFPVMRREEEELVHSYGTKYEEYRNAVPAFLPTFRPYSNPSESNFRYQQVIVNREYQAVLGFLTVFAFLLVKLKWL